MFSSDKLNQSALKEKWNLIKVYTKYDIILFLLFSGRLDLFLIFKPQNVSRFLCLFIDQSESYISESFEFKWQYFTKYKHRRRIFLFCRWSAPNPLINTQNMVLGNYTIFQIKIIRGLDFFLFFLTYFI